ncbi:hypothetical protein [Marasmitruncus massiliensis]|uniref:hypothetical protein n=1 Tax=Marasmitruncus massiliensis TaxID=1944642 RepID=UPI000C7D264C|nr:hypothetical protein [Marasmitruncus massiliensis]
MNDKTLDALQNWKGSVSFGDHTNEADELRRYRDTGLTPEKIASLKDIAIRGDGYHKKYSAALADLDAKDAEIATLKKALEMMYQDNKGYNHDGTGNSAYYIQKARADNAC